MIISATPYLPGSFDRTPRNPAEKISSGYKAWEWLIYFYCLGPVLFRIVLLDNYWRYFCLLISGVQTLQQHRITQAQLSQAHKALVEFVCQFELMFYQCNPDRLHFLRQCIHILVHIAPETFWVGPSCLYSQWTMERTIGNLGDEIRQHSNPFANLSEIALRRCRVYAVTAMIPGLDCAKGPPRGSIDLGGGYRLLRTMDTAARSISPEEEEAIITFFDKLGENIPSEWKPQVVKWAHLQLPNGQIARSA